VQGASIILADEPIASLDPSSARRVMDILTAINSEDRTTVVVSLHQVDVALAYCPRTIALSGGRIAYDGPSRELTPALLQRIYGAEVDEMLEPSPHSFGDTGAGRVVAAPAKDSTDLASLSPGWLT
jgi:phosphonate transport system ATP-binding protein